MSTSNIVYITSSKRCTITSFLSILCFLSSLEWEIQLSVGVSSADILMNTPNFLLLFMQTYSDNPPLIGIRFFFLS